jgi:hypothetical protein
MRSATHLETTMNRPNLTDFGFAACLSTMLFLPLAALSQDKSSPQPTPVSHLAPGAVLISGVPLVTEREETARIITVCLEGEAARFQRKQELTDGDTSPFEDSIRRCYRIVRPAEGSAAK